MTVTCWEASALAEADYGQAYCDLWDEIFDFTRSTTEYGTSYIKAWSKLTNWWDVLEVEFMDTEAKRVKDRTAVALVETPCLFGDWRSHSASTNYFLLSLFTSHVIVQCPFPFILQIHNAPSPFPTYSHWAQFAFGAVISFHFIFSFNFSSRSRLNRWSLVITSTI